MNIVDLNRGEDVIARKFRVFKPMLIQYIIFWKTDPGIILSDSLFNLRAIDKNVYLKDFEIQDERNYILIYLQMNIKPHETYASNNGWVEVTTSDLKRVISSTNKLNEKWIIGKRAKTKGLKLIGNYQLLIAGSEEEYWTKSQIDIHKFKIDANGIDRSFAVGDVESESNISAFNKLLFGSKRIIGDRLENLKLQTTIYGLGNNISDDFHRLPKSFLLNLTIDSRINNKEGLELQDKQYKLTINTIISNFGRLLVYNAKLIDLYKDEYSKINSQSNTIREKALRLQMRINSLLLKKSDTPAPGTSGRRGKKAESEEIFIYQGMEERLLFKASRYFSLLTEINHYQARANYERQEVTRNIDRITQTLGLAPITLIMGSNIEIQSFSGELKKLADSIDYNFQNLKIELDHSQTTIRNTVEILKTFLESEQRIVTQKSSEAINWIVIVFAGLGLADALGNFVVFYLQGGSGFQAMVWFFIVMLPLLLIVVILYILFFKRPHYLKSMR